MQADSAGTSPKDADSDPGVAGDAKPSGADENVRRSASAADAHDPRKLAEDWITVWQSELSALAADPEVRQAWQTTASLWAVAMSAMLRTMPRAPAAGRDDDATRCTGAADASRASAAAAAPDPRDIEINRLAHHVAALERRLADLERSGGAARPAKRRPRRKP